MSQDAATEFIQHVGQSRELQAQVDGLTGPGALDRLVALGADHGFEFTADEYRAAVVDLAEGELSDEALDEVLREAGLKRDGPG